MHKINLRKKIFTTPNFITLFRFSIIFVLFWVWFTEDLFTNEIIRITTIIILFTLGSLSDFLDGYWARHYGEKSKVGAFMDSLVDKFYTLSFFIAYLYVDLIQVWWVLIVAIVAREIYITGMRINATINNLVLVTEKHGKSKMLFQIIFQSLMWIYMFIYSLTYENASFQEYLFLKKEYLGKALLDIPPAVYFGFYNEVLGIPEHWVKLFKYLPNVLLTGVSAFTVYSGINYIVKNSYSRQA